MRKTLKEVSMLDVEIEKIIQKISGAYAMSDRIYMWPEPVSPY